MSDELQENTDAVVIALIYERRFADIKALRDILSSLSLENADLYELVREIDYRMLLFLKDPERLTNLVNEIIHNG